MNFQFVLNHYFVPVPADVLREAVLYEGEHNFFLVAISGLIAIVCAYIALSAVGRSRVARPGLTQGVWMAVGAVTMGVGVWAMHFVGMLAFEFPGAVHYDPLLTVASMLPGVVSSSIALSMLRLRRKTSAGTRLLSAVLMASGVAAMHYTGMAAMHTDIAMYYDGMRVALAVGVAVVLGWVSISIPGYLAAHRAAPILAALARRGLRRAVAVRLMAAIGLGAAVTGMHNTAMWAALFVVREGGDHPHAKMEPAFLAVWVMLAVALLTTAVIAVVSASKQRMHADELEAEVALRRRVESAVEEQRARLQAIIDNVVEGIITINASGTIQHWSPAAQALFGYTEEEITGQNVTMLMAEQIKFDEIESGDGLLSFGQREFRQVIGVGREAVGLRKDGTTFPLDLSIGYGEVNGKPFYTGVVRDLTQRKAELALLEEARDRAEQAVRAKSEFLANMSHEIRTPMNGVLGFVGLALERGDLSDEVRAYLRTAQKSANNLLVIIDDILDFSRLESGHITLETVPFDLRKLVRETIESLSLLASDKSLRLTVDLAEDLPVIVTGDPTRIRQILINLISNAIKFTHQGHVSVKVTRMAPHSEMVLFSVTDTGIGMSPETLERVLQPFEQADTSTHRLYGGTGLGTTISLQLAQLHGGELWAESEEGVGSTFFFTASLAEAANAADDAIVNDVGPFAFGRCAGRDASTVITPETHRAENVLPREKASGADRDTLRKLFEDLYKALDKDNPDPVEQVLDEMSFVLDRGFVTQIRKSVSQFDFGAARKKADLMLEDLHLR